MTAKAETGQVAPHPQEGSLPREPLELMSPEDVLRLLAFERVRGLQLSDLSAEKKHVSALVNRVLWTIPWAKKQISEVFISKLTPRQQTVLMRRTLVNLQEEKGVTLKDLGKDFGVKWQRISQIENHSIRQMHQSATEPALITLYGQDSLNNVLAFQLDQLLEEAVSLGKIVDPGKPSEQIWEIFDLLRDLSGKDQRLADTLASTKFYKKEGLDFMQAVFAPLLSLFQAGDIEGLKSKVEENLAQWRKDREIPQDGLRMVRGVGPEEKPIVRIGKITVEELGLRVCYVLRRAGVNDWSQLLELSVEEILAISNLGIKSLISLGEVLKTKFPTHPLTLNIKDYLERNPPKGFSHEEKEGERQARIIANEAKYSRMYAPPGWKSTFKTEKERIEYLFGALTKIVSALINNGTLLGKEAKVAQLRFVEKMTIHEIASSLGITVSEAKKYLKGVRGEIRKVDYRVLTEIFKIK